jgi:hypothetical protein
MTINLCRAVLISSKAPGTQRLANSGLRDIDHAAAQFPVQYVRASWVLEAQLRDRLTRRRNIETKETVV